MSGQHTPGPWSPGKAARTVVSEAPIDGVPVGSGHSDVEYYGGNLIAESIWRKEDVHLIAAAPDMLDALRIARETIKTERDDLFDCHVNPADGKVHDAHGRARIAEFDNVLTQISAAVSKATGAV